jgi:acetyl-CoA carboxylase, biotin carboxylase subunit
VFRRILIANRGEVAARIARAARDVGAVPVGVASEADLGASWLDLMEEVVCLGPAAARESYLDGERVLQAALQTGCSALHPGWGFLAEDARFAALVEQHGVTFVGPRPDAIARMGLKSPAKAAMRAAGLPVIPGSDGSLVDVEQALVVAREVGYPVLLKADAGGGGRGMRRAENEGELRQAYEDARREAESAFGSGSLYLERYLAGGRHVEVQVLADAYGHALHLFERECSVQRKHQKLLEEAPSPALTDAEREALGLRAAEAVARLGYRNAGTIEFFRSPEGELYFMEMNTRLQVEHPVSEAVTGLDIAAWQLRLAAGQRLALKQSDVRLTGAAIEVRINAEDPTRDFQPTPGTLAAFEFPTDRGPGRVRVDTHLTVGDRVSPHYDSLLAKVIAHGETRAEAIETMERCLAAARVEGVSTTIALHRRVLADPEFRAGRYDTRAIPGWPPRGSG